MHKPVAKNDIWSGTRKTVSPEVEARFDQEVKSLGDPAPDPEILNLGATNIFTPANGETVSIAAVRVSIPTVSAWFTGHYTSKAKGASFFVGGIVPVDF